VAGTTKGDFDDNTSFGGCDIILIKYDVNGLKQWTKQLGTSEDDWGTSVAVDSQDNIYVTGSTKGDFDGNTGFGDKDIVLIKFDASGTKEWTKQMGTHSTESGSIVRADSQDNIYVAGETTGELDGNEHAWREDIFLMKFDSSGTKEWTQQLGGEDSDWVYDIAFSIGSLGDWVVVTGYTLGEIDGHTSQGDDDIFIVLYDSNGLKQNSKQIGTEYSDKARGVAIDSNDNIYITGETRGQFEGNSNQSNGYRNDIFLLKYNLDFEPIWHQQLGVAEHDWGTSIVVDQSDNLFVTGATTGGLDENESAGGNDISLMKYNSDGVKQWVKQTGSSANDIGERLVLDADGNIYITGHTYGSLYGYTNTGGIDLFMMKYNVLGEPE
jgi:hypothetical protein